MFRFMKLFLCCVDYCNIEWKILYKLIKNKCVCFVRPFVWFLGCQCFLFTRKNIAFTVSIFCFYFVYCILGLAVNVLFILGIKLQCFPRFESYIWRIQTLFMYIVVIVCYVRIDGTRFGEHQRFTFEFLYLK